MEIKTFSASLSYWWIGMLLQKQSYGILRLYMKRMRNSITRTTESLQFKTQVVNFINGRGISRNWPID